MTKEEILVKLNNPPFKKDGSLYLLGLTRIITSTFSNLFFVDFITRPRPGTHYYRVLIDSKGTLLRVNIL